MRDHAAEHVQVRLLGPVDVTVDGSARAVPGRRRKAVLATLGLRAGQIVSTDHLIDVVWGDHAPATAANTLQSHLSYLRRTLGARAAIVARPPGYQLDLSADATDVAVAERLMRQARQSVDRMAEATHLRAALDLWRDHALLDVAGLPWLDEQAERLGRVRVMATRALTEARMALGEHAEVVPQLEVQVKERPFDEHLHGQLMLALYRAGRQADALAVFQHLRHKLADDLGVDPNPALRDLERAILRQDPLLELAPPPVTVAPPPVTVVAPSVTVVAPSARAVVAPAQLPPPVPAFAGRGPQLACLDSALTGTGAGTGSGSAAPVALIATVCGVAGVGKTALAVHWGHRAAAAFPDGQLYVNLRGFDAAGAVRDPAEVLRGFLQAFGVPAERIPEDRDARTGLYRSTLAGRRVLVLLDNARDADQVRPLLPGSPGCRVVVTSRTQLTSLVATEAAAPLSLDVLPATDALDLLVRRLGRERVAAEADAADEIVARCGRLPLALSIVAARAATRPGTTLAQLATQLRDRADLLDEFDGGDAATNVRAVFSWSYRGVSPPAAALFRLLGLHPGAEVSEAAAASMAGLPVPATRARLAELTQAHLLISPTAGRFSFHDLLRVYAAELALAQDDGATRRAALRRLLDHCLHSQIAADRLLFPHRDQLFIPELAPGVEPERPEDEPGATAWFGLEYPTLVAAVRLAAQHGFDQHAWQLPWSLATYLNWQGNWTDMISIHQVALAAATRSADLTAESYVLRCLGMAAAELGQFPEATTYTLRALELAVAAGDRAREAQSHLNLSRFAERQGRPADALRHSRQALDLSRADQDPVAVARCLNNVGWAYALLGDFAPAFDHCDRALALQRELGDREGEATTWDSLGYAHRHRGDLDRAAECYRQAVELYRANGDRSREAETLVFLGDTYADAGDWAGAQLAWQRALPVLDESGAPAADEVRARLSAAAMPADRGWFG